MAYYVGDGVSTTPGVFGMASGISYGCERWTLKKSDEKRINSFEMKVAYSDSYCGCYGQTRGQTTGYCRKQKLTPIYSRL